ncbi:hypothetical protein K32_15930 [Kaistia sp. 32K]|nr:hypothetical protein K32_15930 [Kaistia sp. 32K]
MHRLRAWAIRIPPWHATTGSARANRKGRSTSVLTRSFEAQRLAARDPVWSGWDET